MYLDDRESKGEEHSRKYKAWWAEMKNAVYFFYTMFPQRIVT